jgi:hypothetical protein
MPGELVKGALAVKRSGPFSIKELLSQPDKPPEPEARPVATKPPPLPPENHPATAAEALPSPDDLSPLPGPGAPYVAAARLANKPLTSLVLVLADASARGFSYANLDTHAMLPADQPGQGLVIALRFYGVVPQEVRLAGRHLDMLYSHLSQHRIWWVRERGAERDFCPAGEPVITGISFHKVEA